MVGVMNNKGFTVIEFFMVIVIFAVAISTFVNSQKTKEIQKTYIEKKTLVVEFMDGTNIEYDSSYCWFGDTVVIIRSDKSRTVIVRYGIHYIKSCKTVVTTIEKQWENNYNEW